MSFSYSTHRVADLLRDGVLWVEDGNHGENRPLSDEFCEEGTPFVRPDDLKFGAVVFSDCDRINEVARRRVRKGIGRGGDILFTHRATVGRMARVAAEAPEFVANPGVTVWRVLDRNVLDSNYLYYAMQSKLFMDQVWAEAGNTDTFPYISLTQQRGLRIVVPEVKVQRKVGAVLGALDDRIAVLRETNATLESIAQALFKSWFVDFDPVRAKQQGLAPVGMDEAISELFPALFEDSILGSVPQGWHPMPVYDVASFINGAAYKSFQPNADCRGRPIIKIAELKSGVTSQTAYSDAQMPDKYLIATRDILFAWSGNPDTSIDTFVWAHEPAWLNQHIFRVVPAAPNTRAYVLQLLKFLRPVFAELARNKQTTGLGHVTVADLKRLQVAKPSAGLVEGFEDLVGPIQERSFTNERQALTLAALRDNLLPRLISGQLRLPEAEALAA